MAMEPYEIIVEPYTVWLAPVGEAFPAVDATPAGNWSQLGTNGSKSYHESGVTISHPQTIVEHFVAGSTGPVKASRTQEGLMISFTLVDVSLEYYTVAINNVAPTIVAPGSGTIGTAAIQLRRGFTPATFAFLARGPSPYLDNANMQYEVKRAYPGGEPAPLFAKGQMAGLLLEFAALEDPDAVTDDERFGRLIAQNAAALP